jgi:hypothetical protein
LFTCAKGLWPWRSPDVAHTRVTWFIRDKHEKSEKSEPRTSLQYRTCRAYSRVSLVYRIARFPSFVGASCSTHVLESVITTNSNLFIVPTTSSLAFFKPWFKPINPAAYHPVTHEFLQMPRAEMRTYFDFAAPVRLTGYQSEIFAFGHFQDRLRNFELKCGSFA